MGNKRKRIFIICGLISSLFAFSVIAWSQVTYELSKWSVDSGGFTLMTTDRFSLSGTLGQADAGNTLVSTSGQFSLGSGFWHGSTNTQLLPIFLSAEPGYENIRLTWNVTNFPSASEFRLSRAISGTTSFQSIATTSDTVYFDVDTVLSQGQSYCYQVEALNEAGEAIVTSNLACSTLGLVELWMPEVFASPGDTAFILVKVRNAEGLRINSAEVWLEYDSSIISPANVRNTSLTSDYTWDFDLSGSGQNSIVNVFTSNTSPPVLRGSGSLFWLEVNVLGADGSETPLNLLEFVNGVGGSVIYTPDDFTNSVPLTLNDSTFSVDSSQAYLLGDVNLNGVVQTVDASLALQSSNQTIVLNPQQSYQADVNGDGFVSAADASMILFYVLNEYWPVGTTSQILMRSETGSVTASLNDVSGSPGDVVTVSLSLSDFSDWAGADVVLAYDQTVVANTESVSLVGPATGFDDLQFEDKGNGLLYFSMAEDENVSGAGKIIEVGLRIRQTASNGAIGDVSLASMRMNDVNGRDFTNSDLQIAIIKQAGSIEVLSDEENDQTIYLPLLTRP